MAATEIRRVVEIAMGAGAGVASYDGDLWRMTGEYYRLSPTQPHGPTRIVIEAAEVAATPCCTMAVRHGTAISSHREPWLRPARIPQH